MSLECSDSLHSSSISSVCYISCSFFTLVFVFFSKNAKREWKSNRRGREETDRQTEREREGGRREGKTVRERERRGQEGGGKKREGQEKLLERESVSEWERERQRQRQRQRERERGGAKRKRERGGGGGGKEKLFKRVRRESVCVRQKQRESWADLAREPTRGFNQDNEISTSERHLLLSLDKKKNMNKKGW